MFVNLFKTKNKYNIIKADPPWDYTSCRNSWGSVTKTYKPMKLDDIKKLPVADVAADDCVLLMWCTAAHQKKCMAVIDAWGFTYKTMFVVWCKTNKKTHKPIAQLGFFTKQSCEYLLLASKGKVMKLKNKPYAWLPNIIFEPRREHSRKPDYIINPVYIDGIFRNVPKLELFARNKEWIGWDCWGNQTNKFTTKKHQNAKILKIRHVQKNNVRKIYGLPPLPFTNDKIVGKKTRKRKKMNFDELFGEKSDDDDLLELTKTLCKKLKRKRKKKNH